ncbi:hypothetical protein [Spirosoma montaniterrae]|uniref:Transporter n=1 Tax=Spirosoma montaniterrae TaxID=1178516 RepID=A0A1P9WYV4_9BACT|nr:hypothetical protein [Spirosoma montaniterrae]AQG80498.1 hypothetical protein AWR27_14905 [Spirosoma montaniterrae]
MKSTYTLVLALAGTLCVSTSAWAQMPTDAIYMPKKTVCIAGMYGQSSWTSYWEGTRKRENFNIGTHTTQSLSVMPAIGITNRLNLILNLPYVWTSTSAGNLMGQRGIQDLSAWLKANLYQYNGFSVHALVGGSLPVSRYVPDFLPMSIGLQSRTATGRLLLNYTHPTTGLYVTTHGSYTWRSNINVDRDSHFTNGRLWNSSEMQIPNMYDAAARVGVLRKKWQTEVFVERMAGLSGDDIRRNDMPYPTNNMQATQVGWYGKLQPKNIGVNARVAYVTDGRNVGQSTSFMVGVLYQFAVN